MELNRSFRQISEASTPEQLWQAVERVICCLPLFRESNDPQKILAAGRPVVLYGAGRFADAVISAWQKIGIRPQYCVDSDVHKWGKTVNGIPILAPEVVFKDENKPLVVIAAMATHGIDQTLDRHGVSRLYAERDGSVGFLPGHWLSSHRARFERVYAALGDDFSRQVLLAVAKARMFQRFHFPMKGNCFSVNVSTFPQYFPEDLFTFSEDEVFIDCGAFDGDTLVELAATMWRSGVHQWRAVAFEVDSQNVQLTRTTLETYGLADIEVINAGVGKADCIGNAEAFHTCRNTGASGEIPIVALDTALEQLNPTMIKMDIEGDELDALAGAKRTIARCKPRLAVCVYHLSSHLIDIPLYLLDNHPEYRIYLRHHSPGSLWETVCYAAPIK